MSRKKLAHLTFTLPAVFLMLVFTQAQAATISSDFGIDAEGWIGIPGEGELTYLASGGNPNGYIAIRDIGVGGPLGSGAIAPAKFSGNLLAYDNGLLSTDLSTLAGSGGTFPIFGTVRISGAGDQAFFDLAATAPPPGVWQSYSAPLTAAAWGKSSLEWMAILGDVTEIAISTDAFDGADTIGIDNFTLTSPSAIPLPAAFWLFATALVGLIGWKRKAAT